MAKTIRANLELAPEADILSVLAKDAQVLSTNKDAFVKSNLLCYYAAINTWLLFIKQWSTYGWVYLWNAIKTEGLTAIIRKMDNSATELIRGEEPSYSIARAIYRDVIKSNNVDMNVPSTPEYEVLRHPTAAMLMICRYLKRLSPLKADRLTDSSLQDFVDRQKVLRQLQQQGYSPFITSRVREYIANMLDWDALCNELESVDVSDISFTPGVSFDTNADYVSKLQFIAKTRVEYFPVPFGVPLVSAPPSQEEPAYWGKDHNHEVHAVYITAVPKNYKTARVIAPEDVYRQALARRYFTIMDRYTPETIKLHDQTQNQRLAYEGSLRPDIWSTLDLHAASDTITWSLLVEVFPPRFVAIMKKVLPTHYCFKKGDKKTPLRQLQSTATMGNSCTFWIESILFNGTDGASTEYVDLMINTPNWSEDLERSTYGDDIVSRTYAAETTICWLEALGFVVNEEKSYFTPSLSYRESCGVEYLNGINLTGLYFPRFPIEGNLKGYVSDKVYRDSWTNEYGDALTSLVSLQNRLFPVCVPASLLLAELIYEAKPNMTTSVWDVMSEHSDVMSYEEKVKVFSAPAGEFKPKGKVDKWRIKRDTFGKPELDPKTGKPLPLPILEYSRVTYRESDEDVVEYQLRRRHLAPCTAYEEIDLSDRDRLLVDLYNYQKFLKNGPQYDSPLDRLLRVSRPPMTYSQAKGKVKILWKYVD